MSDKEIDSLIDMVHNRIAAALGFDYKRSSEPLKYKRCVQCGIAFIPVGKTQRFCTKTCGGLHSAQATKTGVIVGCVVCGARVYMSKSTYELRKGRAYCPEHQRRRGT